ncbi:MAG: alpha/beta hydrolase [Acidimicrobiales bacterium]
MASTQAEALKTLYRSWVDRMAADPEMGLPEMRDLFEAWHQPTAEPEEVTYAEVDAGGVPSLWCLPLGCADDRVIVFTHGGGYVVGSRYTHRKLAGHLAKAAGCRALVIDYRLAPEFPHPAPVEDAVAAYRWLLDQGIEAGHIATCGDSAGGGLCTAMVLKARDEGLPLPAAIMPLSPWYDMEGKGDSLDGNAAVDVLVQREILMGMATTFLGEASAADPLANPLYADLDGLPPVFIQVGGDETLLDDSHRFAERARDAGVDVTVEVHPEMQHVFHFLAGRAPEADEAIADLAAWVRPHLGLS